MESSQSQARKHGLDHYLNKPDELNDLIFKLMLLQETIQIEQAQKMQLNAKTISTKRTVHGKFVAASKGDEKYQYAVETALRTSTAIVAVFQRRLFIQTLRSMGVPEEKISEFTNSLLIHDDTHCIDPE
jgi:hypothetical protein